MELLDLLPHVTEYGAVGVMALALYLIARMYLPHAAAMARALEALPPALAALTGRIDEVEEGLHEVRGELAVIRDRLPRSAETLLQAHLSQPPGR